MRAPWGKLGALSQKINPLGAAAAAAAAANHNHANHHTQEAVRNGEENASAVTHVEPAPIRARWSFRQTGSRSMKWLASEGKLNGSATTKDGNIRIDISVDECSDLLGEIVMTGNLTPPSKGLPSKLMAPVEVSAKLTTKAFMWALHCLYLDDIVAISSYEGSQQITVHSFARVKTRWVPSSFGKPRRRRMDMHFKASSSEEAVRWATAFGEQGCYVNLLPCPEKLSQQQAKGSPVKEQVVTHVPMKWYYQHRMLVVLNPRSGRGRARKVFRTKVQPILELAGFKLMVVETTHARHAQNLASTIDLSKCPDGIICVGGDGIVNEVLNGLLSRDDAEEARRIPLGIIPAGSDNSLVWTVLGIRDPISAAVAIVKGGLVASDVIGVEWTKTGAVHMGLTVAYYGFMSDVLECSAKYQQRWGPLRYFVAGTLRLLCLSHYACEVQYLPAISDMHLSAANSIEVKGVDSVCMESDSSLSNDSCPVLVVPPRLSNGNLTDIVDASFEPSDYVRGLDGKTKRVPSGWMVPSSEDAVTISSVVSSRARTRSKSRSRSSSGLSVLSRKDSAGSCLGESLGSRWGPLEGPLDAPFGGGEIDLGKIRGHSLEEEKWESRGGMFLGVIMCNHQCKTVQCLESQALAPGAEHDDGNVHLLLVRDVGRFQLLRFVVLMQFGRHLSLPFVEYVKARAVWLKPATGGHRGCGIDGELLTLDGPIMTRVLPHQCYLIGKHMHHL